MTLDEWKQEAEERFGTDKSKWSFICPNCGHVQSIGDFGNDPEAAFQECVGRRNPSAGCKWVSYGFIGTVGKGIEILFPDGHTAEVFDFAPITENEIKEI